MNLLFVCSENRLRSPTAERVFMEHPGVKAIGAGHQRRLRLEAQVREVRIARRDVRRVGDDQVEAPARDRAKPLAVQKLNLYPVLD